MHIHTYAHTHTHIHTHKVTSLTLFTIMLLLTVTGVCPLLRCVVSISIIFNLCMMIMSVARRIFFFTWRLWTSRVGKSTYGVGNPCAPHPLNKSFNIQNSKIVWQRLRCMLRKPQNSLSEEPLHIICTEVL